MNGAADVRAPECPPIYFLSGMGADGRLLQPQAVAFPTLKCLPWRVPGKGESVAAYALRMLEALPEGPCILGGISFGGVIAQEMAAIRPPIGIVLISSLSSPAEIALPTTKRGGTLFARAGRGFARLASPFAPLLPCADGLALQMLADSDSRFLAWAMNALVRWTPPAFPDVPTLRIHGTRDLLIRPHSWEGIVRIPGGGHLLNLTHRESVNAAIAAFLQQLGD